MRRWLVAGVRVEDRAQALAHGDRVGEVGGAEAGARVWTAGFAVGRLVRPVGGGVVLTHLPWPKVFLVAVPPMLLLLAVGPSHLPEARDARAVPVDVASAALSLAAVLAPVLGISGWPRATPARSPARRRSRGSAWRPCSSGTSVGIPRRRSTPHSSAV